jgi:hypothetical protein
MSKEYALKRAHNNVLAKHYTAQGIRPLKGIYEKANLTVSDLVLNYWLNYR